MRVLWKAERGYPGQRQLRNSHDYEADEGMGKRKRPDTYSDLWAAEGIRPENGGMTCERSVTEYLCLVTSFLDLKSARRESWILYDGQD